MQNGTFPLIKRRSEESLTTAIEGINGASPSTILLRVCFIRPILTSLLITRPMFTLLPIREFRCEIVTAPPIDGLEKIYDMGIPILFCADLNSDPLSLEHSDPHRIFYRHFEPKTDLLGLCRKLGVKLSHKIPLFDTPVYGPSPLESKTKLSGLTPVFD